jgi:hypothetical protein
MMQADLRVEAKNLLKFYKNFEGLHEKVIWPKLIPDLVSYARCQFSSLFVNFMSSNLWYVSFFLPLPGCQGFHHLNMDELVTYRFLKV